MMRKMMAMAGGLRDMMRHRLVLLALASALLPVFVGSPCGDAYPPEQPGRGYANRAPQWAADGQSIVVNLGYRIYRVSMDGSSITRIPAEGEDGQFGPSLSAAGRIAYMDATGYGYKPRLTTSNGSGERKKRHIWRGICDIGGTPVWSPDGSYAAFSARVKHNNSCVGRLDSQATIMNEKGTLIATHQPHFPAADNVGSPVWSNDGRQVAFSWYCHRRCMVTVMDTDGNGRTVVDAAEIEKPGEAAWGVYSGLSSVAWAPDDRTIYYALKQGWHLPTILYATNLSTLETRHIIDLGNWPIYNLSISPDGDSLMFTTNIALIETETNNVTKDNVYWKGGLFTIGINGAGLRDIIEEAQDIANLYVYEMQASWSPDGSRIAFTDTIRNGAYTTLFTIAPDGSDLRVLTEYDDDGNVVPANAEPAQP